MAVYAFNKKCQVKLVNVRYDLETRVSTERQAQQNRVHAVLIAAYCCYHSMMASFFKTALTFGTITSFILQATASSFSTTTPSLIPAAASALTPSNDTVFLVECNDSANLWQGDTIESTNPKGFYLTHNAGKLQFFQGQVGNSSSILRWQSTGYTYDGNELENTFTRIQEDHNIVVYTTDVGGYLWSSQSHTLTEQGCFLVWSISRERLELYANTRNDPGNVVWNSDQDWVPFNADLSSINQKIRSTASRISATLSIFGSGLLIGIVVSRWMKDKRLLNARDRLLLGMSFLDFFASVAHAFAATPIPEDSFGIIGTKGNTATCAAQGFFIQVGFGVPLYNAMICIYILLMVRYKKKESFLARKVEPGMHFIALGFASVSAIIGLCLDLYNSNSVFCWIEPYPYDCAHRAGVKCLRGENAHLYQWLFGGMVIIITFLIITVAMLMIYCTLRSNALKMKHHYGEEGNGNSTQVSETGKQAFLYLLAFLLTFLGPMLLAIFRQMGYNSESWLHVLVSILFPLQGFWNIVIFLRPPFRRTRRRNQDKSFFWVLKTAIVTESTTLRVKPSGRRFSLCTPSSSHFMEKSDIIRASKNISGKISSSPSQNAGTGIRWGKSSSCPFQAACSGNEVVGIETAKDTWGRSSSSAFQGAGSGDEVKAIGDVADVIDMVEGSNSSQEEEGEKEQY